jgi:hypothetical protein
MDLASLMRLADALITAVLVLLALGGMLLAWAAGQLPQLAVAMTVTAAIWLPCRRLR